MITQIHQKTTQNKNVNLEFKRSIIMNIIKCSHSNCNFNDGCGNCESDEKKEEFKDSVYVSDPVCEYFNNYEADHCMDDFDYYDYD